MEQHSKQPQSADLYIALDSSNEIIAMEKSRQGNLGFISFLDEFTQYAANKEALSPIIFFNVWTKDLSSLPRLSVQYINPQLIHTTDMTRYYPSVPYVDDSVLQKNRCLAEYDMRASQENFWKFTSAESGEALSVSQPNFDLATLQQIAADGYHTFLGDYNFRGMGFSFEDDFSELKQRYLKCSGKEEQDRTARDGRAVAKKILKEEFPDIRSYTPKMSSLLAEGVQSYRDFDTINILFRGDKLLEEYERNNDNYRLGHEMGRKR